MNKAAGKILINLGILSGIGAALFFLFEPRTAAAIIALIVLVGGQFLLLNSRIRTKHQNSEPLLEKGETLPFKSPPPPSIPKQEKPPIESPPEFAGQESKETGIDPGIFSKFQQNLDQSTNQEISDPEKSKPKITNEDEEVVVTLSAKAKGPNTYARPSQASQVQESMEKARQKVKDAKQKESKPLSGMTEPKGYPISPKTPLGEMAASVGSLFDDLSDPLTESPVGIETPQKSSVKPKREVNPIKAEPQPKNKYSELDQPLASREILTSDDLIPEPKDTQREEGVILSLAQTAFDDQKTKECLNILNQWLSAINKEKSEFQPSQKFMEFKAICEFDLRQFADSAETWRNIFETGNQMKQEDFLPLLEDVIDRFSDEGQHSQALTFYFTALNLYQKQQNFLKMDFIYNGIEKAYQADEDWDRLIQTYQNHLVIKKNLEDFEGQLDLLNHLGKLLYDRGDADGSKVCYEQSMEIKKVLMSSS